MFPRPMTQLPYSPDSEFYCVQMYDSGNHFSSAILVDILSFHLDNLRCAPDEFIQIAGLGARVFRAAT